jgi:hypothetical protein
MKVYNFKDIQRCLYQSGIDHSSLNNGNSLDKDYALPAKKWVLEASASLAQQIKSMVPFKIDRWDCDDYCLLTMALMRLMHSNSRGGSTLAVGMICYGVNGDRGDLHAINFAIVEGEEVLFFEPQNGREVKLAWKELRACTSILF